MNRVANAKDKGPATDFFENPRKIGWLTKLGGTGLTANWRRRYVVLDHHYLFYYKTDKDKSPAGIVCLPDYDIVSKADSKECKKPNAFMITSSNNIVPGGAEQKRVYYMYTESEEETEGWIQAILDEMIAMVDPEQKHYFSLDQLRAVNRSDSTTCPIDTSAFDDLATIVDDIPKLEHVTASRPKKPMTRAPSRGMKEFTTFDEDDIASFALSPISEEDGSQFGKLKIKKQKSSPASSQIRPINKPLFPTADTTASVPDRLIMKPKPPAKPKTAVKPSNFSESIALPVKNPETKPPTPAKHKHSEVIAEAPKPIPRRKAPSIPDPRSDSISAEPPSPLASPPAPPTTSPPPLRSSPPLLRSSPPPLRSSPPPLRSSPPPLRSSPPPLRSSPPPLRTSTVPLHTSTPPLHTSTPPLRTSTVPLRTSTVPLHTSTPPLHTSTPPLHTSTPPLHTSTPPLHTSTPPLHTSTPPLHTSTPPLHTSTVPLHTSTPPLHTSTVPLRTSTVPLRSSPPPLRSSSPPLHTSSPPLRTSSPPLHTSSLPLRSSSPPRYTSPSPTNQNRVSNSSSGSSHRGSVGVSADHGDVGKSNHSNRDSSSSSGSSSGNSDSIYQIPNNDPIYQIPRGSPVSVQNPEIESDTHARLPVQRLHSIGLGVSSSPKQSLDLPDYSNMMTGYLCSSPQNRPSPPASPTSLMTRYHSRSNSLPRSAKNENYLDPDNGVNGRRFSVSPISNPRNTRSISPLLTEPEVSGRLIGQIRELEDQLSTLTSVSPRRESTHLSSQSKSLNQVLSVDTQRLIDQMKSVVLEAISFHKQASEELQKARTEHQLAERERKEAATHTLTIQKLLSSVQPNINSTH